MPNLRWDLALPQGANLELGGVAAEEGWRRMLTAAEEAERLGYDSVWALDRTETLPRREPHPVFDGWTTLAAVSQRTQRVGLGHLGVGAPVRDAAELAKRAACLDVMSGGRMTLALEADGYPPEHEAHGRPVPDPTARRAGLVETVTAVRRLWTEPQVSTDGPHVRLDRAFGFPQPLAARPPVHVFDDDPGAPSSVLASVDPAAIDGVIWHAAPEQVRAGTDELLRRCTETGADPDRIERTVLLECRIFDTVDERDTWLATPYVVIFWSEHPDLYMRRNVAGTVAAARESLQRYVDAGATRFLVWFRDYPELTSVRRLMTEVVPGVTGPRELVAEVA
ncbi:MAG TPA: LLM class flavin-dependent oxidoreductase [Actinophytocola sp.]|uniref:LLM class flavin-dependent oxidoreductase n=1 Tax=Actinophytocola sp. TaxID=1872138 RepID=UPI002DB92AFF|nr:LLM class flavin-dependent oxidoreductase [Actinophytocola sp.]HEU5473540.1 LLM class flavin-dependent oxidoreductase [Actinophytocola sp.]